MVLASHPDQRAATLVEVPPPNLTRLSADEPRMKADQVRLRLTEPDRGQAVSQLIGVNAEHPPTATAQPRPLEPHAGLARNCKRVSIMRSLYDGSLTVVVRRRHASATDG